MSPPGPKPKPTAIRQLENNPSNAPYNEHEPKPKKAETLDPSDWMDPECPYMSGEGKFPLPDISRKIWDEMAPELDLLGVLKGIDFGKFSRYCETFARWLKMKAFIDKNGETYPVYGTVYVTNPETNITKMEKTLKQLKMFPQVAIYLKLGDALRKYEEEFGIGAASRTRIQTIVKFGDVPDDEHDFDYAKKDRHLSAVKKTAA